MVIFDYKKAVVILIVLPLFSCTLPEDEVWTGEAEIVASVKTKYVSYDVLDNIQTYTTYQYDDKGRPKLTTNYLDAGPNMTWFDGDDTISSRHGYDYTANGRLKRAWLSTNAGVDGIWGNADDDIFFWVGYQYDVFISPGITASRVVRHHMSAGPGMDGDWFTNDDVITNYVDFYSEPAFPSIEFEVRYVAPGDGIWFNGNDVVGSYYKRWKDDGHVVLEANMTGPGAGGVWFDANDTGSVYNEFTYDQDNNEIRRVTYGTGGDTIPFTGDDTGPNYRTYYPGLIDEDGVQRVVADPFDPGANGIWFDIDDLATAYSSFTKDPLTRATYEIYYNSGPDQRPYTNDDFPSLNGHRKYQYDSHGFLSEIKHYRNIGGDGRRFTPDDQVSFEVTYTAIENHQTVDPLIDGIF